MNLPEPSLLQRDVREAAALPSLAPERERLERLVQDYARGHAARDEALVVALVGATGAGKSTLLNALAGEGLAAEGVNRPTSRAAVVYAPEGVPLDALERKAAKVARYRLRPGAPWAGQVFIDTPDVNSVEAENRDRARALLDEADVALVVMHKGSIAEAAQAEFLADFAARRRLLWVVNFADELGPQAREQLKGQVRALAARRGEDPSGELPALLFALGRLAQRAVAEKVRQSNAAAVLRELKGRVAPALARAEEGLAGLRRELEKGLAQAGATLGEDFSTRLQLASGHLAGEVRRRAASRGWGPAAWWMRLSLVGSGGVAAATLVARRSLPIGLAVGAVSAALDKVQEATRARAAERRVVEAAEPDDDGTLSQAARAALTGARAAAHRMGLAPEDAGLPDVDALLEELAQARARAWRYTEESAVAAAVGAWWRWARFIVVPLVNLPLLALFADVAWRVARAYLRGPLLGAGYYLNAIALGLVLSVAGGLLASLSLAGAARKVRGAGRRRFDAAMAELAARLLARAEAALLPAREAAGRLAALEE